MELTIASEFPASIGFDKVEQSVRDILAENGFGILTEIDVKATMKKKLDLDMKEYKILGACNPPRAHKVISADGDLGILLPCNFLVYETNSGMIRVAATKAYDLFSALVENPEVGPVAKEVEEIFAKVLSELEKKLS